MSAVFSSADPVTRWTRSGLQRAACCSIHFLSAVCCVHSLKGKNKTHCRTGPNTCTGAHIHSLDRGRARGVREGTREASREDDEGLQVEGFVKIPASQPSSAYRTWGLEPLVVPMASLQAVERGGGVPKRTESGFTFRRGQIAAPNHQSSDKIVKTIDSEPRFDPHSPHLSILWCVGGFEM